MTFGIVKHVLPLLHLFSKILGDFTWVVVVAMGGSSDGGEMDIHTSFTCACIYDSRIA